MSFNAPVLGGYNIRKETFKYPLRFENYIATVENCEGFGNQVLKRRDNKLKKHWKMLLYIDNSSERSSNLQLECISLEFFPPNAPEMWRFAGLHALGNQLSRNPYYDDSEECLKEYEKEFATVFPEVYKRLHFYTPQPEDKIMVDFAIPCCSFADPTTLLNITAKALVIKGRYLQAYQFFKSMVPEIRNLFSINPTLQAAVDAYKETLFGGDQKHKICIHTRQGDFVALGTHSKLNYTEFALDHVFDLQSSKYSGASIILLGEEKPFLEKVKYDKEKIKNVYIPKELSRGEDFSFAVSSCDTFVITAKLSTFAWWIAFLLKEGSMVFYDPPPAIVPDSYESSNLLPHWIPLPYRLKKSLLAKSFYSF